MKQFFDPQWVVLIGVSRQSGPGAYNNLEVMQRYGYRGRIDVVHPKVSEILGKKTVPHVDALDGIPDLAIISVGRDRVLPAFLQCAQKGIRHVVVISQGFADADDRGKELQGELQEVARQYGVRVLGPNTMGTINAFSSFSTAFVDIEKEDAPPPISVGAQTGVLQVGFESFTGRLGKAIDIGNAGGVDFIDVLEYFETDPQTQVIALHMEGMLRGREFLKVARRVAAKKPIVILKTGRSAAGAQAALSHTGSLVGEDAVIDTAFKKAGLIRVRNMVELRAACQALLHFRSMAGPRIGVVTATGACGIMTADACEDYGLELAPFPEEIRSELENTRIAWHRLRNPVDIWPLGMVTGSFVEVFKRAVGGLLRSSEVDAVFAIAAAMSSPLHKDLNLADAVLELNRGNTEQKPIALWLYGGDQVAQGEVLRNEPHVAAFDSIDEAVAGLAAVWRYSKLQKELQEEGADSGPVLPVSTGRPVAVPSRGLLVGEEAFSLLREYQIPLAVGELTKDVEAAVALAGKQGYPMVLKIVSPQWLHKSDWGGVRLGLENECELRKAYGELEELFRTRTPLGSLEGILAQKQIQGMELLMGIKRDPQVGHVLVVGMGGIYTEVFKDVARGLVPVGRPEAEEMVESLRIYPILKGIRGQAGVDISALVDVMVNLSRLAVDYPEISELDLNPVFADSHGCRCVDARIVLE
ncbi:acetate--CoA ligase family protein [Desulforhabdus amnigena]|uniref:CoA-binding protein n=1 Tax=Desulforhabdus amnigena TaxID=40218 RepID=A0A9W6FV53_9BACT|nr:acetate--CoA ligase family protein [Desulforhabdus amnigena]NLJ29433.1 acetate--CoA ligase family protein [Deltaproteobacteria bacterium]GLI35423.1 CoA-binding protein [Desulforhabdus amnigena]